MRLRAVLMTAATAVGIMLVPSVSAALPASAAPATLSCSDDGFFINAYTGQVDHWYSAGGYFTGPYSGHQELCRITLSVGGLKAYQFVIVGGTANGDCVAYVQGGQGAGVVARGCVLGQANEVWLAGSNWPNLSAGKCLNVGTASGDSWGVATCSSTHTEAMAWE